MTPIYSFKFLVLPVVIGVISSVGVGVRFYRTVFLEEMGRDYIRTARAKGLSEGAVLFQARPQERHDTRADERGRIHTVSFLRSLLMETFFAIPAWELHHRRHTVAGLCHREVNGLSRLHTYIVGLILTDISYTLFDPRIRLG